MFILVYYNYACLPSFPASPRLFLLLSLLSFFLFVFGPNTEGLLLTLQEPQLITPVRTWDWWGPPLARQVPSLLYYYSDTSAFTFLTSFHFWIHCSSLSFTKTDPINQSQLTCSLRCEANCLLEIVLVS